MPRWLGQRVATPKRLYDASVREAGGKKGERVSLSGGKRGKRVSPARTRGTSDEQVAPAGEQRSPDTGMARGGEERLPLVGRRIRELRLERGLGVRSLAAASGITSGFLSQIESGRVMPSIATLVRICAVLQVHVGDVFDASGPKARLVRAQERTVYSYPDSGIRDEVLTADPTYRIEAVHSFFAPGGSTGGQLYSHGSQVEAAIVLKGEIVVRVENETYTLRAGDALTFPGTLLHDVRNPRKRPAEVIWIYSPATY